MVNVSVVTIPESRTVSEINEKYEGVVADRSSVIAKRFGMEAKDVVLQFYDNKGALVSSLGPNIHGYGIYSGYVDGTNEIKILHPPAAEGLLNDIDKEMIILIDSALTRFYLCQKYYADDKDFKLYYKYIADCLATFSAGNFHESAIKFDAKIYFDGIKYKKDQELNLAFYVMFKNSGLDFIFEKLDLIMGDCDIKKSVFTIYNKSLGDLIKPVQEEVKVEEKKKQELEQARRAAQREAWINERKMADLVKAQKERRSENGERGPNQNGDRRFVSKKHYKPGGNGDQKSGNGESKNYNGNRNNNYNQNRSNTQGSGQSKGNWNRNNSNNRPKKTAKDWDNKKDFSEPKINKDN